jgi:hypothetical protein
MPCFSRVSNPRKSLRSQTQVAVPGMQIVRHGRRWSRPPGYTTLLAIAAVMMALGLADAGFATIKDAPFARFGPCYELWCSSF